MRHRRTYLPAAQFVDQIVRKHHCNRCWVWEILDEWFNVIKGIGYVMDREQMERAEAKITYFLYREV